MPTGNYLQVIDCEHDSANIKQNYRKDHRKSRRKHIEAYLYTNKWNYTYEVDK